MPDTCSRCGKSVRSTARFCHACGTALRSIAPARPAIDSANSKIFIASDQPPLPPSTVERLFPPRWKSDEEETDEAAQKEAAGRSNDGRDPNGRRSNHEDESPAQREHRPAPPRRLERNPAQAVLPELEATRPLPPTESRNSQATSARLEGPTASRVSAPAEPSEAVAETVEVRSEKKDLSAMLKKQGRRRRREPLTLNLRDDLSASEADLTAGEPVAGQAPVRLGPADFGLRFGAFMLDFLLTLITIEVLLFALSSFGWRRSLSWSLLAAGLIFLMIYAVNGLYLTVKSGQTLGKKILGIQIIRENGQPVDLKTAARRHLLGYPLSALGFMLGFLWILWDPRQQGWHDKISKTIVIRII